MLKRYAIIVAGGTGIRMKNNIPKQFIKIGNLPIVMHTILHFYHFDSQIKIIFVLPKRSVVKWKKLCIKYDFKLPLEITEGGDSRFQSVKNGLKCIPDVNISACLTKSKHMTGMRMNTNDTNFNLQSSIKDEHSIVAIHDGVRPFINKKILKKAYDSAKKWGNAVTSVKLKESLRVINNESNATTGSTKAVDRNNFRLIQTPQCFTIPLIKRAYEQPETNDITDDAALVEKLGVKIHLIEGIYENIKITTPVDLLYAKAIFNLKFSI